MKTAAPPLQLWGGLECSVVRLGDEFRSQLVETGHITRLSDIDAMADLGIKAVRYPILWEMAAPQVPSEVDFSWHEKRLERIRAHGIEVIATLLHHGSGPHYTNLLDPKFPDLLADYADKVARRFPWIEMWTPVNEPLTTARFSCLYGHWYPHLRDRAAAHRAVVNECVATARAMTAVRRVIPAAKLVVTEDVGKTFAATEKLAYQAEHENKRRWLSFDLLTGRVRGDHYYCTILRDSGVDQAALDELGTGAGTPDILGFDHYLTSERYLDHRLSRYPSEPVGGNGMDAYVDVEAVRIAKLKHQVGPGKRLRELWQRYGLPIAITEVHHGCSREEQVRWLHDVWNAAQRERARGADIRAVTLWAMFGMVDWRSVLTRREGHHEPGAFDTRSPEPRLTMIGKAAAKLARGETLSHPTLQIPGWWKRPGRTYARRKFEMLPRNALLKAKPILITGATGTLGQAFARICAHRGLPFVVTTRADLDITDEASIAAAFDRFKPWAVINTAGFVRVDEAEAKYNECFRINVTGPELLGHACKLHGIPLVTFSSDLVFDGQLGRSYIEPDEPAPVCGYGRSKAEAEARLMEIDSDALIVRTSAFFGPWDRYNFVYNTVSALRRGEDITASDKTVVSPTYVPDLVQATLDLLLDEEKGVWHLTNQGAVSWHELACEVADRAKIDRGKLIRLDDAPAADTSLSSKRGLMLRPLDQALNDFMGSSEPLKQLL